MKQLFFLFSGLILLSLGACRKNPSLVPPPPAQKTGQLSIKLTDYLGADKVDSAVVIWEANGHTKQEKMRRSNDSLLIDIKTLGAGTGRLTVQVFSTVQLQQRDLQWEKRTELTLNGTENTHWNGPTGYNDEGWFPRVILIDPFTSFTAIIGLRPADPYFLIKNAPPNYKIELERNYAAIPGGALLVSSGMWRCMTVCTDSRGLIENREFFKYQPAQINGREWKMVEVGVGTYLNLSTPGPGFYFNHY
jgi:hypothetical protein